MSKNSTIMKFGEMLTNAANFYTVGSAGLEGDQTDESHASRGSDT